MIESDRRNFYDRCKSSGDRDAFLKQDIKPSAKEIVII